MRSQESRKNQFSSPEKERLPLVPDVGVIALVADEWSEEWMSRHQILTRLAKYFNVVWLSPSEDWQRVLKRPINLRPRSSQFAPGFSVCGTEFWLPKFYRPRYLANLTFRKRLNRARALLVRQGCRKIILYIWRPEFAESLDVIPHDLSCYHIVDEYSFSDTDQPNSAEECGLLKRAGQVFVHTHALLEKKGALGRSVTLIPNGVAYSAFSSPSAEPASLAGIPHPRIGYAGYLKKTLDWSLLAGLSERHPQYSFVFVGSRKEEQEVLQAVEQLSRRPNVHFIGSVPSSEMVRYPQHFDVCIMPYLLNDYTKYVYPLKLHEYLASGRPIVASPTRLLREFQDVIRLSGTVGEWSAAIEEALQPAANSIEARQIRQDLARKHDWDVLVRRIVEIFCEKLDLDLEQRLD